MVGFHVVMCSVFADKYVAPIPQGTGDGSSAANAASYLDEVFWNTTVQNAVDAGSTTVWFARATYDIDHLKIWDIGHPVNVLTLAVTAGGGTFEMKNDNGGTILSVRGSQRITIKDFIFTGATNGTAVYVQNSLASPRRPSRWIRFEDCTWKDLTNLGFGALNITNGSDSVTLTGCLFENIGPHNGVHMMYCAYGATGISITNCTFKDGKGDYVRFRDDTEYSLVDSCTFQSTAGMYNWEFIRVPVFNDASPVGDEFFGGNLQFTNNTFTWTGSDNPTRRWGVMFTSTGHNVASPLDYTVNNTTDQATLASGTQAQKNTLLSGDMGLDNTKIKIYGNTYTGQSGQVGYWHHAGYGTSSAGLFTGTSDISNWPGITGGLATRPLLRNGGFEYSGDRRRCWIPFTCALPKDHLGLNGSAQAIRLPKDTNTVGNIVVTSVGQILNNASSTLTVYWIAGVGSDFVDTGMKFKAKIYHNEIKDACLVVAVDDQGNVGYENSSGTFVPVGGLGTLLFAIDGNGDGTYHGGAGDAMRWYEFKVVMDYSGATPYFTISRSNVNAAGTYPYASGNISTWAGSAPATTGANPSSIAFESHGANVILDGVQ